VLKVVIYFEKKKFKHNFLPDDTLTLEVKGSWDLVQRIVNMVREFLEKEGYWEEK